MSRVDEERDAERVNQRRLQEKLAQEAKKKDRAAQESQFASKVAQQKSTEQRQAQSQVGRDAIEHLLEGSKQEGLNEQAFGKQRQAKSQSESRGLTRRMGEALSQQQFSNDARSDHQQSSEFQKQGQEGQAQSTSSRTRDAHAMQEGKSGRADDAKTKREVLSERAEGSTKSDESHAAEPGADKGELKTDADKGGQGGQSQGQGKDSNRGDPSMFRLNPALMAPVPVAQKKPTAGNERLRQLANEIAQKIVERVRVGTNALGNAEFQIDLRGNVLSGLQVKVSAKNGRISAVFSGRDRDVLRLLEEQEKALSEALTSRGLQLEQFKVEGKA